MDDCNRKYQATGNQGDTGIVRTSFQSKGTQIKHEPIFSPPPDKVHTPVVPAFKMLTQDALATYQKLVQTKLKRPII